MIFSLIVLKKTFIKSHAKITLNVDLGNVTELLIDNL